MSKLYKVIKLSFIFSVLLFGLFTTFISNTAEAKIYNARFVVDVRWDNEEIQKPIIPRDEIKQVFLNITLRIDVGESFGAGVLEKYAEEGHYGVVTLSIEESPSWCSVALESTKLVTDMKSIAYTNTSLYINIDEDAPAYGEGFIKIRALASSQGLIEGQEKIYTLDFLPSFNPILKINLPEKNTKRINPMEKALFPIEVENIGNARTKLFFSIEDLPTEWQATVTDVLILDSEKGSKVTAYLTIVPPKDAGYHYSEANFKVKIIPARAEDITDVAYPLYASFTVQNRGLSTYGSELILFYGIFALIIVIIIVVILRYILRRRKATT